MIKMTRACPAMARPTSPKSRCSSIGMYSESLSDSPRQLANLRSPPPLLYPPGPRVEGGVAKHHQPHSPGKSFKTYTKTDSTAECLAKLKNLLPNARLQKHTTEVRELAAAQSGCQQSLCIARYGDRYHSSEPTDSSLLPSLSYSLLWWKRPSPTSRTWRASSAPPTTR